MNARRSPPSISVVARKIIMSPHAPLARFAATLAISISFFTAGCKEGSVPANPAKAAESASINSSLDPDSDEKGPGPFTTPRNADLATKPANPKVPQGSSPFRFTDIRPDSGIDFKHFSGMTLEKHYPSANGSGVAIFDYDGDGKLDLYFASCTLLPLSTPAPKEASGNHLYRSLGDGKYEDVTEKSGLGFKGFCHGIVAGDFDNDGDADLILACYGPNRAYKNNGDGTFTDVSASAGVEDLKRTVIDKVTDANGKAVDQERTLINWTSGGATIDYDGDGDLDVYLSTHGDWRLPEDDKICGFPEKNIRLYCSPRQIRTAKHILFRNNGDWTFTDVTDEAGIGRADGHGFGVVAADLNNDGKTDLYVANDQTPNFLFINKGDGTFTDATESSGAAFDIDGSAQSGMGVEAEDVDGDGLPELFVTNFQNEYNTLYRNNGDGFFTDMTPFYGLAQDTRPWVGWGCALADFDSDGWPDCFVTNGYVDDNHPDIVYDEPPLLHRNVQLGNDPKARRFKLATRDVGPYFDSKHVGRGVAFGDLDNDGDIDIVVNQKGNVPAILRNDTPLGNNHWLRLKLIGTKSNRDAVGAKIEVLAGGQTIHRQRKSGTSMLSTNDPRITIGLGAAAKIDKLTVKWPSGSETVLENLAVDQEHEIQEPK
jgi:enediyne biosynthesis protein E4